MSLTFVRMIRYAAVKLASDPQTRERAADAARLMAAEARRIGGEEDRARAAGRSLRRVIDRLQRGR